MYMILLKKIFCFCFYSLNVISSHGWWCGCRWCPMMSGVPFDWVVGGRWGRVGVHDERLMVDGVDGGIFVRKYTSRRTNAEAAHAQQDKVTHSLGFGVHHGDSADGGDFLWHDTRATTTMESGEPRTQKRTTDTTSCSQCSLTHRGEKVQWAVTRTAGI